MFLEIPYISDSLVVSDFLLQNNGVNTGLEQRKYRRRLSFQSPQRIKNFCAGTSSKIVEKCRKLSLLSVVVILVVFSRYRQGVFLIE